MAKMELTMDSLKELSGGVVPAAFNKAVRQAAEDCINRPGDESARKVVLEMSLTPREADGVCDAVETEFSIDVRVPKRRTRRYELGVDAKGRVLVNPESPGSIHQNTLDEQE